MADEFVQHAVPQHTGMPDEISYSIALTNDAGQTRRANKFASCRDDAFDRMLNAVVGAIRSHLSAGMAKQLTF